MLIKYECPICKKIEWGSGFSNQTGSNHPRICKHGDLIIVMKAAK